MSNEMQLLSILVQTGLYGGKNIPALLEGFPGIGKTQVMVALGKALAKHIKGDFPVEVFTAPQRMPEEVGGIPVPDFEKLEVNCLPMRIGKNLMKARQGIIFIDEYSSAGQAMGGACMTLIQDGRLGDNTLSERVARVAAMNPVECAANGRALTAPESNRFCWISWKLDINDWFNYMRGGGGVLNDIQLLPQDWEKKYGQKNIGLVISFLRRHPDRFDVTKTMPKKHDASRPWESPRSWENSTRLLAACEAVGQGPDSDLAHTALSGCLGEGTANMFLGWYKDMDMPDPEELLKDPVKAQELLPKGRPDKLQVALEAVATAACQAQKDEETLKKRWKLGWEVITPTLRDKPDNALWAAKTLADLVGTLNLEDMSLPTEIALVREILENCQMLPNS